LYPSHEKRLNFTCKVAAWVITRGVFRPVSAFSVSAPLWKEEEKKGKGGKEGRWDSSGANNDTIMVAPRTFGGRDVKRQSSWFFQKKKERQKNKKKTKTINPSSEADLWDC